ncbi:MAG: aminopeptidase P family protein [Ruminococcus sp.]|nr:aminopeptidase P family protein [Ruminococcus sp.]
MSVFIPRIEKISNILKDKEAALVTSDISITYLTGFQHSEGYVFITEDKSYFLIDFRYAEAVQKAVNHMEIVMFSNAFESINELIAKHNITSILVEDCSVTLSAYTGFNEKLNAEIQNTSELSKIISESRIIKTADEIEKLRTAQKIAEKAYLEVLNFVKPGITEREISARLEFLMKMNGAERVAFELITVTGKKTSLPHGVPGDVEVQAGDFVTFDIGAVYDGYHSDMTRTVAVGSVSDGQKKIYDIVLKAHLAGMDAVKAGVSGFDVDKVCRDIITEAGYGQYFGHSTGHGVGLEIHEAPNASQKSEHILKENMTLTVEPGIYLPDKFGVRIEDTVLVTKEGFETFASMPKELIIL